MMLLIDTPGGINLNVNWDDATGSSNVQIMGSATNTGGFAMNPWVIYARGTTTVEIVTLVSGSAIYDVFGIIEVLI